MPAYKERLAADLDRWIAAGLAPAEHRKAMLALVPESRRLDAATALAWVGGVLLGIAAISFVAANWDALPRLARFALVLGVFAAAAGAGAWAANKVKPLLSDIALTLSALLFAAAIGLTGQIFDIIGEPRAALHGAGLAAFALALAGGSRGAACAALLLIGLGDFADNGMFGWFGGGVEAPWLILAAPLGVYLALRWRSAPLAHAGAIGVLAALFWFADRLEHEAELFLLFAAVLAGAAAAARWLFKQEQAHAGVLYGWAAWGALLFFVVAGYAGDADAHGFGIAHRLGWLAAAGALIALGRFDRHMMITTVGVLSLIGAIAALLTDLGLDLMMAAGLFFLCALAALVGGLMLRKKPRAPA
jgi:Predicted membrane protein (DUF2157)